MVQQIKVTISGPRKSCKTWVASAIINALKGYGIDVAFEGLETAPRPMPIPQGVVSGVHAVVIEAHDGTAAGM